MELFCSGLLRLTILPWRKLIAFPPQAQVRGLRPNLGVRVRCAFGARLLVRVALKVPGGPGMELVDIHVAASSRIVPTIRPYRSFFAPVHDDRLSLNTACQMLPRNAREGLAGFRCVDAGEADFMLDLLSIEHSGGIAVVHRDDPPGRVLCQGWEGNDPALDHGDRPLFGTCRSLATSFPGLVRVLRHTKAWQMRRAGWGTRAG